MSQHVVEDPTFKQRLSFSRSVDVDGSEVLHVETWVEPGGGVPAHVHPAMEERFQVLEGRASFLAGRKWRTAGPGETVIVPAGVRHAYRNRGDVTAHVVCQVRPPSRLQEFLEDAAALGRAGKLRSNGMPRGLDGLLKASAMAQHYSDMTLFGFPPLPPRAIQRLAFPLLAPLGERRGFRAGHMAEAG
jgi:quercetin dioxygenase-like cupin family protein